MVHALSCFIGIWYRPPDPCPLLLRHWHWDTDAIGVLTWCTGANQSTCVHKTCHWNKIKTKLCSIHILWDILCACYLQEILFYLRGFMKCFFKSDTTFHHLDFCELESAKMEITVETMEVMLLPNCEPILRWYVNHIHYCEHSIFWSSHGNIYVAIISSMCGDAYIRQWAGSWLIMHVKCLAIIWANDELFCQLKTQQHVSVESKSKCNEWHSRKCIWNAVHKISAILCRFPYITSPSIKFQIEPKAIARK